MKGRSVARHARHRSNVELHDLKRAAATAGGSRERRVHGRRHRRPPPLPRAPRARRVDELRVTLPISIRTPDDPPGGNRITLIRFAGPGLRLPTRRRVCAPSSSLCRTARDERSLRFTGAIAAGAQPAPARRGRQHAQARRLRRQRHPRLRVPRLPRGGSRVERYVAFAPTTGTAVEPRTVVVRRDLLRRHLDGPGGRCRSGGARRMRS